MRGKKMRRKVGGEEEKETRGEGKPGRGKEKRVEP